MSFGTVRNHPSRSGFDLSRRMVFSAKVGEILPVYWTKVLPGNYYELKHQNFTRTMPVTTPAFTRIREYFDWYYVPLRLLNKNVPPSLFQLSDQPVQATSITESRPVLENFPYTTSSMFSHLCAIAWYNQSSIPPGSSTLPNSLLNMFGFKISACMAKLWRYMRYGNFIDPANAFDGKISNFRVSSGGLTSASGVDYSFVDSVAVDLSPFLSYQKIYQDHFRFEQWEKAEPFCYNTDYYPGTGDLFSQFSGAWANHFDAAQKYLRRNNIFTLRYCNWMKDIFQGVMPSSQLGSVATIPVQASNDFTPATFSVQWYPGSGITNPSPQPNGDLKAYYQSAGASGDPSKTFVLQSPDPVPSTDGMYTAGVRPYTVQSFNAEVSVLQLRLGEALQKYREVSQCAGQTYREQLYAHFNVKLSKALSDLSYHIGGSSANIDISEVVNTNLVDENAQADLKGKGVGTGHSSERFKADEHGILMCLYHAVPLMDYVPSGVDPQLLDVAMTDYPIPEFDSIGMESLSGISLWNSRFSTPSGTTVVSPSKFLLGYVPRYIGYKTAYDIVTGMFETTQQNWVAAYGPKYLGDYFTSFFSDPDTTVTSASTITYAFFKCNPHILDSIFGVECDSTWDTDQLQVNAYFDVSVVQNLDYNGMPY